MRKVYFTRDYGPIVSCFGLSAYFAKLYWKEITTEKIQVIELKSMCTFLADAAKRLGADDTIMHSYWEYHERRQNWFFSPNPNLASATRRPSSLPKLETWKKLNSKERLQEWKRFNPDYVLEIRYESYKYNKI